MIGKGRQTGVCDCTSEYRMVGKGRIFISSRSTPVDPHSAVKLADIGEAASTYINANYIQVCLCTEDSVHYCIGQLHMKGVSNKGEEVL